MDWITGIQRAIDYIEENLMDNLNYDEISKRAYSSSHHFQRVFGILCGHTLGEYIRERRLTLAGSELVSSDIKVIDVAMKYGYDSPESFGVHLVMMERLKICVLSVVAQSLIILFWVFAMVTIVVIQKNSHILLQQDTMANLYLRDLE